MKLAGLLSFLASKGLAADDVAEALRIIEADNVVTNAVTSSLRSSGAIRQANYRKRKASLVTVTGDVPAKSKKEAPHTPKEKTTPSPSDPKGSSVDAPKGAARGHRLPEDFEPNASDIDFGRGQGLSARQMASSLEDMKLWAWSNSGAKVVKLDWHKTLKGFFKRDAKNQARAGPHNGWLKPSHVSVIKQDFYSEPAFDLPEPSQQAGTARQIAFDGSVGHAQPSRAEELRRAYDREQRGAERERQKLDVGSD